MKWVEKGGGFIFFSEKIDFYLLVVLYWFAMLQA